MTELDSDFVRAQFPEFADPDLQGWAFFENAGGSYACRQVIDRLTAFYTRTKVQPYAPYPVSERAGAAMDESRHRLAAWLNVAEDELHFGPSTSQNAYVLAHAFREWLSPGDEIVVTNQDHEANSGAWRRLADAGIVVREWQIDPESGHLAPEGLAALLTEKTRLVAFPQVSNIVGAINPVPEISAMIRDAGAVSVVDGVSGAPHGLPDVAALGCDIYLFSSYKTYGPHLGIMTVRRELAERLPNQGHWFNAAYPQKKLTPAGPDHAQIAAAAGMVDYFEALDAHHGGSGPGAAGRVHDAMRDAEIALTRPLLDYLRGRNDIRVLGPAEAERKAPTIAIHHNRAGEDLARDLAQHRIMTGGGSFYANRVVEAMGIDPEHGVLRLSFLHYTTPAEIDQVIEALDRVL